MIKSFAFDLITTTLNFYNNIIIQIQEDYKKLNRK